MSAREEMSKELSAIIKREYTRAIDRKRMRDCYDAPAAAILAWIEERYTPKPRTITTAEELDALPQGTKLYSSKTTHSWHLNDFSPHGGTKVQGTGGGYTYLEDFIKHEAPLTVLHEPKSA